jgi:hypothetical protein
MKDMDGISDGGSDDSDDSPKKDSKEGDGVIEGDSPMGGEKGGKKKKKKKGGSIGSEMSLAKQKLNATSTLLAQHFSILRELKAMCES